MDASTPSAEKLPEAVKVGAMSGTSARNNIRFIDKKSRRARPIRQRPGALRKTILNNRGKGQRPFRIKNLVVNLRPVVKPARQSGQTAERPDYRTGQTTERARPKNPAEIKNRGVIMGVTTWSVRVFACRCDDCGKTEEVKENYPRIYNGAQAVRSLGWSFGKTGRVLCGSCRLNGWNDKYTARGAVARLTTLRP